MFKNKELKNLRKMNHLSQSEVAEKIGKSQQSYAFYETGRVTPDADTISKLADFFHVPVEYLFSNKLYTMEENSIVIYGRGSGPKKYKLTEKRLKAIQALLDDDNSSNDIDF